MNSNATPLIVDQQGAVLTLTLNRPEKRNAINDETMLQMRDVFLSLPSRPEVRVVVLTAVGDKAFCAGADLGKSDGAWSFDYATPTTSYANMLRAGWQVNVPIIARINGHCLAGGMGLLAIADLAVTCSGAKFGLPEVKVGVFPMQVAAILQSMIPARKFAELCYTGELISADEALALDLVNYVVEPDALDDKLQWLIARVADKSPTAIRRGKHALRATSGMSFEQAIAFMESQVGTLPLTEDGQEGLAAFSEKRAPVWTGR